MSRLMPGYWEGDPTAYHRQERESGSYQRYVPALLSELRFTPTARELRASEDAAIALAEAGTSQHITARAEMIGLAVMRSEAMASSFIEGLAIAPRQLVRLEHQLEMGDIPAPTRNPALEVMGNLDALQSAAALAVPGEAITVQHIHAVHHALMRYSPSRESAGLWRSRQSWIGGLSPLHAAYVGPPAELVPELMDDLLAFINDRTLPAVITAAIAHAQFEAIHPYGDGNGRTGRALVHLILRQRQLGGGVFVPLSQVLRSDTDKYVTELQRTHPATGAPPWGRWCEYFAHVLEEAAMRTVACDARLQLLADDWALSLEASRRDSAVWKILPLLLGHPVVTSSWLQLRLGCTAATADAAVQTLVSAGILQQVSTGRRNRVFEATAVLAEVDRL